MRTLLTTTTFDAWCSELRGGNAKARIAAHFRRAEYGNMGDCEPVGQGVSEMHIHYGPGYRVYFIQRSVELVILPAGAVKARNPRILK
jgi:putative addiction module killer protein